jgi:DNA-binding transcriptional regulator YdaS (Cro superfamily)
MTSISDKLKETMRAKGYASEKRAALTAGVSQPYFNQVANGARLPSAEWLNTVASAWGLTEAERIDLHRAAAKAHGFEIDLTEGKKK